MDVVLERLARWEAAGLLDAETAARLRTDEAARTSPPEPPVEAEVPAEGSRRPDERPSAFTATFGPAVSVGEMFSYLGGAFLLAAYGAFLARLAADSLDGDRTLAAGQAIGAAIAALGALWLQRGDARRRRAAGVLYFISTGGVFGAGLWFGSASSFQPEFVPVFAGALASVVAAAFRVLHRALTTHVGLLLTVTGLAAATLGWLQAAADPLQFTNPEAATRPDPLLLTLGGAIWWLGVATILGLAGLREARASQRDAAAGRRAGLTRLWAGFTAVIGVTVAMTRSTHLGAGEYGRVLEPWVADLGLVVLAAVLVERAFRREASAFVYAAALALIVALTDFNFSYLSSSSEVGLLLEGLILLGAGFAADRLRRRVLARRRPPELDTVAPSPPAA